MTRLKHLSQLEARPDLVALIDAAHARDLPWLLDEDVLTLGAGIGHIDLPLDALPPVGDIGWPSLHDVPTAVVTGSNGKTTTVRLIAACARAHGWRTGYNCTDGLFLDGSLITAGDYSGPVGARSILRDRRVQAAVLETARGGILRRGLAVSQAQVAVVTNVSSDHFGEYGIHDLDALAAVKLVVANLLGADGLLVVNADDPLLRARAASTGRALSWFARDADDALLLAHRAQGGATAGVRAGRLVAGLHGQQEDLGAIDAMPLTVDGSAVYNVANLAAAALASLALGITAATIAAVYARFGAEANDNPGRLMRYEVGGVRMLMDYAHNPDGLRGLLEVARHLRASGRLALVLGQAGNRQVGDIEQLAATAAEASPGPDRHQGNRGIPARPRAWRGTRDPARRAARQRLPRVGIANAPVGSRRSARCARLGTRGRRARAAGSRAGGPHRSYLAHRTHATQWLASGPSSPRLERVCRAQTTNQLFE
jgi:folylpolyglutamate synthase/dihydropteroate synthase